MQKTSLESSLVAALPWLIAGLALAPLGLLFPPSSDRRWDLIVHLSLLVVFLFALALRLAPATDRPWYGSSGWTVGRRWFATAVSFIVIVTGVTALVTLASSAALRFEASLQFLQLLSALDIAWVVAGTMLAVRWIWGSAASVLAGAMMATICVASIALYVAEVGLDPNGGWLVDGDALLRLVLPFDVAAPIITIALTLLAIRRRSADGTSQTPVV